MEEIKFNLRIAIKPKDLILDYKSIINDNIEKNVIQRVSKNHGYILSYSNFLIKSNIIKRCDIIFNVEFTAQCLIPKIGVTLTGSVSILNHIGLFIDVQGKLKVLVNKNTMTGYEFQDGEYVLKKDNSNKSSIYTIKIGSVINVYIRGVKYENNIYKCFGTIV
jgi:DNA-directed RNA polymerase subunit E'/Rpb7